MSIADICTSRSRLQYHRLFYSLFFSLLNLQPVTACPWLFAVISTSINSRINRFISWATKRISICSSGGEFWSRATLVTQMVVMMERYSLTISISNRMKAVHRFIRSNMWPRWSGIEVFPTYLEASTVRKIVAYSDFNHPILQPYLWLYFVIRYS